MNNTKRILKMLEDWACASSINLELDREKTNLVFLSDLRNKIDDLVDHPLTENQGDPWCYDLQAAPLQQEVLCVNSRGKQCVCKVALNSKGRNKFIINYRKPFHSVVAWMPLPARPKEGRL